VLDGDDIVYVCRSAETRIISINLLVGARLPAYCTSMGQVLLAQLPADTLEAYLGRVQLIARTASTTTTAAKLRKRLKAVREADHALLDQELEVGLRSIAVPVRDARGTVIAAMNVSTHASQVALDEMERRFLPVLTQGARSLSTVLLG
jgi:IclR family pca regulon transcriptional regulator